MSTPSALDTFAVAQTSERRDSVRLASKAGHEKRTSLLFADFEVPDDLRRLAGSIKQHVIENLDTLLPATETRLSANGVKTHWAFDAAEARDHVLSILRAHHATRLVKAKTMVSEEIELGPFLAENGVESVETDLGEFIVQIDGDHPSHIVKPILHKNRREIARSFEQHGLGAYNDDPETITRRARVHLRQKYLEAHAAITGANFISAESGRIVLVTNEGNSRFCLAATPLHIVLVGIEKIVPRDRDLAVFLNLLARSGSAQQLTVYTEFISGPRAATQPAGPLETHVIFVDNGRTDVLASDCREILRCIRCGACLNVCPVYRQASGHAYRSVYPGPVGAVLSPLLAKEKFPAFADLPKASSLCGACHEVCPVDIPIPDLLLRLRNKAKTEHAPSFGTPPMTGWSWLASSPTLWKTSLAAGKALDLIPGPFQPAPLRAWQANHTLPEWRGGSFRRWWHNREKPSASSS